MSGTSASKRLAVLWLAAAGAASPLSTLAAPDIITVTGPDLFILNPDGADIRAALTGGFGPTVSGIGTIETLINSSTITADFDDAILLENVGSVLNNGRIEANGGAAAVFTGDVGSFTNAATGEIVSTNFDDILVFMGDVDTFRNDGLIEGDDAMSAALFMGGTVGSFENSGRIAADLVGAQFMLTEIGSFHNAAGGSIEAALGGVAISTSGIDAFSNAGRITASDPGGFGVMMADVTLGTFHNQAGGRIEGGSAGVLLQAIEADSVDNGGTIRAGEVGLALGFGEIGSVNNSGVIEATEDGFGMGVNILDVTIGSFRNTGLIAGDASGMVIAAAEIGSLVNEGTIRGGEMGGIEFDDVETHLINRGLIEGDIGVLYYGDLPGSGRITNSGTVRGIDGVAIDFDFACGCGPGGEDRNDLLTILTGSKIFGAVNFGAGDDDTLNFAGFAGNTVLSVPGLDGVVPGARHYLWDQIGEEIAIFDLNGIENRAIGRNQLDLVVNVNEYLRTNSAAQSASGPQASSYAPGPRASAAETAVRTALDTTDRRGVTVWSGVLGSINTGASPGTLGGILAGTHAALDPNFSLCGVAGYAVSAANVGAGQSIQSQTALLGMEGEVSLGIADIDFSLLGGAQAYRSSREVAAGGGLEIAQGLFTGMFIAPSAGVELPVLTTDGGAISLTARASYVAGRTTGYTETGSSMNLTVGSQTISAVDVRAGVEGSHILATSDDVTLVINGRGGVFAQRNGGNASVPVSFGAADMAFATPATQAYGVYGGIGTSVEVGGSASIRAELDGTLRSDGGRSVAARAGLTGSF